MKVIVLCHLHMPLYFRGTFTEYPCLKTQAEVRCLFPYRRIL